MFAVQRLRRGRRCLKKEAGQEAILRVKPVEFQEPAPAGGQLAWKLPSAPVTSRWRRSPPRGHHRTLKGAEQTNRTPAATPSST